MQYGRISSCALRPKIAMTKKKSDVINIMVDVFMSGNIPSNPGHFKSKIALRDREEKRPVTFLLDICRQIAFLQPTQFARCFSRYSEKFCVLKPAISVGTRETRNELVVFHKIAFNRSRAYCRDFSSSPAPSGVSPRISLRKAAMAGNRVVHRSRCPLSRDCK